MRIGCSFSNEPSVLEKWSADIRDYEAIYRQALKEMQEPDFHATWNILTAWGSKPD